MANTIWQFSASYSIFTSSSSPQLRSSGCLGDRVCSCLQSGNKKIFKATSTPWRLSRVSQVSETFLHFKKRVPVEAARSLGQSVWFRDYDASLDVEHFTAVFLLFFVFLSFFFLCMWKNFPLFMGRPELDQLLELTTQEFIHPSSGITWCSLGITCSWVVLLLLP